MKISNQTEGILLKMDLVIREMTIEDLDQVMVLERENFSVPWSETGFFTFLMRSDVIFLCAQEGERIVGYCGAVLIPDEAELLNVSVDKSRQGQGIGGRLLEELLTRLEKQDIRILYLEVRQSNESAKALYRRMGFVCQGVRKAYYSDPVEDALWMSLTLSGERGTAAVTDISH